MLLPMSPTDSLFLTMESRNQPMHVGGLHIYTPPADAGPDYVREIFERMTSSRDIAPLFQKRARRSITSVGQWGWEEDEDFDIEHHVRHNGLPAPGRILELLALCSRLHGTLLDRERPLWEVHLIEGLNDGRFAMYTKIHHSLVDGMAALRLLQNALSRDPDERDMVPPWEKRPRSRAKDPKTMPSPSSLLDVPTSALKSALSIATDAAGLPGALVKTLNRGLRNEASSISFSAPKSMFNTSITGSRRFAAQDWPLERINAVRKASGTTLNDVVLAMCSGALRSYMLELNALPDAPLISMVPVALAVRDRERASGNAVGSVMVNLATHDPDAGKRLHSIHRSMSDGKHAMAGMSQMQILAMSAMGNAPMALQTLFKTQGFARPPYNLVISNVPGPRFPLYLNGARLDGMYPLSIPLDGQALNITCMSYMSDMAFGLTGCRRKVPHLQRILGHLDVALSDIEDAVGLA